MSNNSYNDAHGHYPIKTIGIEDVDRCVYDYFTKKLKLQVSSDKGRKDVSVVWALGERWALIRKSGFRDNNGVLMMPLLSIRRTSISKEPGFYVFGQETPYITITKTNHPKTPNIQSLVKQRKITGFPEPKQEPVKTVFTIPFPDTSTLHYQVEIRTQYETHMNEVLERIFQMYENFDSFVMPMDYDGTLPKGNRNYCVGYKDGEMTSTSNTENITDQERIIQYQFSFKVPACLILDPQNAPLSYGREKGAEGNTGKEITVQQQTKNQIKLAEECMTLTEFNKKFGA